MKLNSLSHGSMSVPPFVTSVAAILASSLTLPPPFPRLPYISKFKDKILI